MIRLSLLLLALPLLSAAQHKAAPPNIVFILADDMGIGDARCYNAQGKIPTPHTDRMAARGMRFTDAHSASAVCTPSRYAILTGRYAWRSRLQKGVLGGYSQPLISKSLLTVPALLKEAGYSTGIIGKWHLGMGWQGARTEGGVPDFTQPIMQTPTSYGFDYYFGISASLDMPPYVYIENDQPIELPTDSVAAKQYANVRAGAKGPGFVFDETLATLAAKTRSFINTRRQAPFFLYLPLPSPHTPLVAGKAFQGKSGIGHYADYMMETDWLLGQVMDMLEEAGVANNTLVIFTSDNGYAPYAEYNLLRATGHEPSYIYRGAKADIYEGGHRVPFLVQWPGKVRPNTVSNATICQADLMATCAALLGKTLPEAAGADSYSLLPLLQQKGRYGRKATVHHSIDGNFAIREGDWKLILTPGSGGWSAPRTKAAREQALPEIQLYDLRKDPAEKNNLQQQQPGTVERLTGLLEGLVTRGRSTPGAPLKNDVAVDIYKRRE